MEAYKALEIINKRIQNYFNSKKEEMFGNPHTEFSITECDVINEKLVRIKIFINFDKAQCKSVVESFQKLPEVEFIELEGNKNSEWGLLGTIIINVDEFNKAI